MKDLLVSLPSRGSPERLHEAIDMIFSTCSDKKNFDVQIIIDTDQRNLYSDSIKDIKKKHTNIIVSCIIHQHDSWLNMTRAQHALMKSEEYYFFMFLTDDMKGLTKDWDKEIISKKNFYEDGLFCLYSQTNIWNRSPEISKECYVGEKIDVIGYYEHTPIWTKEFGKYFYFLFEEPYNFAYGREMVLAEMLKQLAILGHKRNVSSDFNYDSIVCGKLKNEGFFPEYIEMQNNDFLLIKGIVGLMKRKIKNGT